MSRIKRSRRAILSTVGLTGLVFISGCLDSGNDPDSEATADDQTQTIDAPQPDTLQGDPVIYHGETYNINGTEYTVPSALDRGPQTVQVGDDEINAYISNQQFYETTITNAFTGDQEIPLQNEETVPQKINVEGDTISVDISTEIERNNSEFSLIMTDLATVYMGVIEEDETPYNFEVQAEDGDGEVYQARIGSDLGRDYLNDNVSFKQLNAALTDDI